MAHLGDVYTDEGKHFAKIDKTEAGMRFKMRGPCREDKQQAAQDLADIRAAASGEATRLDELRAMKLATTRLQQEAKAALRGGTSALDSDRIVARIQYVEDSIQKSIANPNIHREANKSIPNPEIHCGSRNSSRIQKFILNPEIHCESQTHHESINPSWIQKSIMNPEMHR